MSKTHEKRKSTCLNKHVIFNLTPQSQNESPLKQRYPHSTPSVGIDEEIPRIMQFSIFVHHKKLGGKLPCGPGCGPLLGGPGTGCMPGSGPNGSKRGCGKPAPGGRPGTGLNPPGLNGKFGNKSPWPPIIPGGYVSPLEGCAPMI